MIRLIMIALVLMGLFVGLQHYAPTSFAQTFLIPVLNVQLSYAWAALIITGVYCLNKLKVE